MHFSKFAILLAASAMQVGAAGFITTNLYVIGKDTVVDDEQWVLSGMAETKGTFKNDLFISSGNLLSLDGIYEGNIWGAASRAILRGHCQRNVRLAGKTVQIQGVVDGNVMALADTILIGTNAVVNGNVTLAGTSVVQQGQVKGNLSVFAGRVVTLAGTVGGHARITAPDILFGRNARIQNDLEYTANKELVPEEGIVAGSLKRIVPQRPPLFSTAKAASHGIWFLAAFLAGIPFIALFPMTTAMATQLIRRSPWKCLLVGMLASGALPIFGIMCLSSLIGVPLGALILASVGILGYLSRIIAGLVLGSLILRSLGHSIGRVLLAMAIGLALIYFVTLAPGLALPVQLTVLWLGMGALLLALLEKRRLIIQVPEHLKQAEALKNEANKTTEE